jgi:hypothetical protein
MWSTPTTSSERAQAGALDHTANPAVADILLWIRSRFTNYFQLRSQPRKPDQLLQRNKMANGQVAVLLCRRKHLYFKAKCWRSQHHSTLITTICAL